MWLPYGKEWQQDEHLARLVFHDVRRANDGAALATDDAGVVKVPVNKIFEWLIYSMAPTPNSLVELDLPLGGDLVLGGVALDPLQRELLLGGGVLDQVDVGEAPRGADMALGHIWQACF